MRRSYRAYNHAQDYLHVCCSKYVTQCKKYTLFHTNAVLQYCSEPLDEESLPLRWYDEASPKLTKLTHLLKNMDLVDGRLVNVIDNKIVINEQLLHKMHNFKALARTILGHPSVQNEMVMNVSASMKGRRCTSPFSFRKQFEREPMTVDNLTKVCNFLDISAQQRKVVRFTICSQVTQHRIFTGTLENILKGLKTEMKLLHSRTPSKGTFIGQQIVSTCLKFLAETASRQDEVVSSWMRPKPSKGVLAYSSSQTWEEVLNMFKDLINCLRDEIFLSYHVSKLEAMKEGLIQIKDVFIDRDIGYKEVQLHESLVQKKLRKSLGHSSQCLFTLLRYYLHQSVRDMEVDVRGGLCEIREKDKLCLCMGKILTSSEEKMVWNGIRSLDRVLGLFKFVWETAGMKRKLELQGHMWCVGAESKTITYRGNMFFIHRIDF